jgi:hypothetical protein
MIIDGNGSHGDGAKVDTETGGTVLAPPSVLLKR